MKNTKYPKIAVNKEVEVRLEDEISAEFGYLSNDFRIQLECISEYLSNIEWFKLYKFENGSRITTFHKEEVFKIVSDSQQIWMTYFHLFLMAYFIFEFEWAMKIFIIAALPLALFKPFICLNKKSIVYRASKVVDYSPKIVFEYLKSHYRQEVQF